MYPSTFRILPLEYFKKWNFTDAISTDYLYAQSIPQFSTVDYNFYAIGELPKNNEKHFYNIRFTIPVYRGNFRPLFLEPVFNNFLLTAAAFGLFEIIWDFQPCEPGELELYSVLGQSCLTVFRSNQSTEHRTAGTVGVLDSIVEVYLLLTLDSSL